MRLYDRRVRLTIATPVAGSYSDSVPAIVITDLRISFDVTKTGTKHPNTATIEITNLSAASRAKLQEKGARVILEAGYADSIGQIFQGDARPARAPRRQGTEWITTLECGDGERAFKYARISESFAPGTAAGDIIVRAARLMGIGLGNVVEQAARINARSVYAQGFAAHGAASQVLDRVIRAAGFEWSIQDGNIQILERGASTQEVVRLTPDSGLIGSPEQGTPEKRGGPPVLEVKSLLQRQIRPGSLISLDSEHHRGLFLVRHCRHVGNNKDGEYYTSATVRAA